jgi:hypothetical protein
MAMLIKLICGIVVYGFSCSSGQQGTAQAEPASGELTATQAYDMSAAAQVRVSCPGGCGIRQMLTFPGQ